MQQSDLSFKGIVFFEGSEHLPPNVVLSIDNIRNWAVKLGLIWDPESQLLVKDRVTNISKVVMPADEVSIAIGITERNGKLEYLEYPYLSVQSLINRGTAVSMVYWKMIPTQWDSIGNVSAFGEVRFGFWLTGCSDEFCSISTATRIVLKFAEEIDKAKSRHGVNIISNGVKDITVDGAIVANFIKQGRQYDVVFSQM